jgi:long-chain acyl-CoA synthetase
VGFIARTTYEWTLVDFALFFAGAVMVPIYETSSAAQISWILSDSGAIAVLGESAEHAARIAEIAPRCRSSATSGRWRPAISTLSARRRAAVEDAEIERRRRIAVGSDIATRSTPRARQGDQGCV